MQRCQWPAAERRLLHDLAAAEEASDLRTCAQCRANLGHVAEIDGRIGDAVRHWSAALGLLDGRSAAQGAEAERLVRLIRRWHDLPRVWISYAHADGEHVARIAEELQRDGIEVFWDTRFLAGHMIQRQILTAVKQCPKYTMVWSKNAV